jgi:hypothetical protein
MKEIQRFDVVWIGDRDQIRWMGGGEASVQFFAKVIIFLPIRDPVLHLVEVLPKEGVKT